MSPRLIAALRTAAAWLAVLWLFGFTGYLFLWLIATYEATR